MTKENVQDKGKPTVSILGAGRMGGALALALASRGYRVEAIVARRLSHARRVASLLGTRTFALAEKQIARLPSSDLVIIAIPDDVIGKMATKLATVQQGRRRTVLHTSGALSASVLLPLAAVGFITGSLHPLVSISDAASDGGHLRGAFFCLEGERAALQVARQIVKDLAGHAFSIESQDKALYHAAAVMASGHVTALFDIACEMLAACGLSRRRARAVLLPLIQSAVTNLSTREPAQALTGTFARGDIDTVQRHLAVLEKQLSPGILGAYVLLGERSLSLANKRKLTPATVDRISRLLEGARKGAY